jgi:16S rRNA (uracil1498-N3)-methyltransferase
MRRFLSDKINNDKVILDGIEHNHLKNVLRLKEGDEVIVVVGDEYDYTCIIEKMSKGDSVLSVVGKEVNIYNSQSDVTVFQALTKHDNMSLIVQKLTELGVKTFVPFESQFITSKDKYQKKDKLQVISNQSIKQCKRSIPMEVKDTLSFNNLVKSLKDYKYTTFEKFVKLGFYEEDWCNFENKNKIADLDFE